MLLHEYTLRIAIMFSYYNIWSPSFLIQVKNNVQKIRQVESTSDFFLRSNLLRSYDAKKHIKVYKKILISSTKHGIFNPMEI